VLKKEDPYVFLFFLFVVQSCVLLVILASLGMCLDYEPLKLWDLGSSFVGPMLVWHLGF
jgi:hypothetical protein